MFLIKLFGNILDLVLILALINWLSFLSFIVLFLQSHELLLMLKKLLQLLLIKLVQIVVRKHRHLRALFHFLRPLG